MKDEKLVFYCEDCKKEFIAYDLNNCPDCGRLDLVVSVQSVKKGG